ncbi:MAG: hypothetical protein H5T96_09085 [Tissierellales bacterium]|nr:hypothetical protein [Tissierellales bacterium]
MRRKIGFRTGSKENYIDFCSVYPEINLTFEEWYSIIYMYSELVRDYILETGRVFKFPKGGFEFTINKRKVPKVININGKERITLPINWKKSKEKGKKIYEMNYHTEGYKFSWMWMNRHKSKLAMAGIWVFKPHRKNKRLLATYLKSGKGYHDKYCEWKK